MYYGETPQSSLIPFLKPGFCKFKRTNKVDPKARGCFYLGLTRNHPSESKRVLVRKGKVITTRNVTWAHASLSHPRWKGKAVATEGTERQARSAVTLNGGMASLSQVARGSRW